MDHKTRRRYDCRNNLSFSLGKPLLGLTLSSCNMGKTVSMTIQLISATKQTAIHENCEKNRQLQHIFSLLYQLVRAPLPSANRRSPASPFVIAARIASRLDVPLPLALHFLRWSIPFTNAVFFLLATPPRHFIFAILDSPPIPAPFRL